MRRADSSNNESLSVLKSKILACERQQHNFRIDIFRFVQNGFHRFSCNTNGNCIRAVQLLLYAFLTVTCTQSCTISIDLLHTKLHPNVWVQSVWHLLISNCSKRVNEPLLILLQKFALAGIFLEIRILIFRRNHFQHWNSKTFNLKFSCSEFNRLKTNENQISPRQHNICTCM